MSVSYVCPNRRCGQHSLVPGLCRACVKRKQYVQVRLEADVPLRRLADVRGSDVPRLPIPCWPGIENVLNGGFVLGTTTALYGDPGIGKSTLALLLADAMTTLGPAAYLSSEQLVPHVKLTAVRVGIGESQMLVGYHTTVEEIEDSIATGGFRYAVIDSLQGCAGGDLEATTRRIVHAGRSAHTAILLVLHVTKGGEYSGPRMVEHEVDGMLALTEDAETVRLDVVGKYRYGPVGRGTVLIRHSSGAFHDPYYINRQLVE